MQCFLSLEAIHPDAYDACGLIPVTPETFAALASQDVARVDYHNGRMIVQIFPQKG